MPEVFELLPHNRISFNPGCLMHQAVSTAHTLLPDSFIYSLLGTVCTEQVGKKSLTTAKVEGSGGLRRGKYLKALKAVLGDKVRVEKVNKNFLRDAQMVPSKPRDLIISAKYRGG